MKDFIDFLKLPPTIFAALSIAGGMLLLLPNDIAKEFYMLEFREKYGFTIGIIFVISISILITLSVSKVYHFFYDKYALKNLGKAQTKYLKHINPQQVALIKMFLHHPTHTLPLSMNNGLVIELQYYNVITPAGQNHLVSMLDPQINYFLQPWVINKINNDEELRQKFY